MTTEETCITSFDEKLEQRGVTRRSFLKLCGGIAAALGLSQAMVPKVANALEEAATRKETGYLVPAIWLELASCTGCTESFASADNPDIATVVLELISLNYAETLSAGAGHSLEEARRETIAAGGYVLIIEGAVMEGWDGNALRIGWDGRPETFEEAKGTNIVLNAAENADAILAVGSCAVDGGWQAADPNPAGAIGVQQFLTKSQRAGKIATIPPIVNIPCCPANPEHVTAVIVHLLLLGGLPDLNRFGMPSLMFDQTIHDNCPRRGHFENGAFVYHFGSDEEKKGYCLYAMGCKGPQTKSNCSIVRWNRNLNWCVGAGAPCAGCATANPFRSHFNWVEMNTPFLARMRNFSVNGAHFSPTWIAYGVGAVVVVALVAHGFGMKATGRTKSKGGPVFELERKWDKEHPDQAIGSAKAAKAAARAQGRAVAEEEEEVVVDAAENSEQGGDD